MDKIHQALEALKKGRKQISVKTVADYAGVARKTIYNNPEILELIRQRIALQKENKCSEESTGDIGKLPLDIQSDRIKRYKDRIETIIREKELLLEENMRLTRHVFDLESKVTELEMTIKNIRDGRLTRIKHESY